MALEITICDLKIEPKGRKIMATNDKASAITTATESAEIVPVDTLDIQGLIYTIRGQQIMIDTDLAALYQVETRVLNQAVKRNIERFPDRFRFQLTAEELKNLQSQIVIASSITDIGNGYGGRRTMPYAFTEQGIAMLSAVLRSKVAVQVSINIMTAFVEMRHFIASNSLMFEQISQVELHQLDYERKTNARLDKIFEYIDDHKESSQKVFFDGQIYDAFSLISSLIQKASTDIILIDGYVDTGTLDLLSKKQSNVTVELYTFQRGCRLTNAEITTFNGQYPTLNINYMTDFHDRFLILDHTTGYHIGASIKDAGKKCFAITLLEDQQTIQDIINRL